MPIVGPGETANDTYIDQLVASAKAAVDKVVAMGVADADHIGVGGHSYGAFMTANLLAHSDLFRAGIARSGAYNRTLTPFGFQNERGRSGRCRTSTRRMSPFWYAHKVNEPILLIHGEADNNSGTFPIQSERFYIALKGHGATVRYVTLPHEAHGYAARESVLHTVAEMVEWADKYIKNAPPAALVPAEPRRPRPAPRRSGDTVLFQALSRSSRRSGRLASANRTVSPFARGARRRGIRVLPAASRGTRPVPDSSSPRAAPRPPAAGSTASAAAVAGTSACSGRGTSACAAAAVRG